MSRLTISIILLIVMSAGCFLSVWAVNSEAEKLTGLVRQTEQAFIDGSDEDCVKYAAELAEEWAKFVNRSILINDLGHALEITSSIAEINSFAQDGNDELFAACDRAEAQVEMFRSMQSPTFWKIL